MGKMCLKLFVVCALACLFQELNAASLALLEGNPEWISKSELYKESLEYFQQLKSEYEGIVDRFENLVLNVEVEGPEAEFSGNFENAISYLEEFAASELNEEAADNNIIRNCIRAERDNFLQLVSQIRQRTIDAAIEFRQFIYETLGPYAQKARAALRALGDAIATFPAKIWECIQEGNIVKAIQVVKETKAVVSSNANIIGQNLREARSKFPLVKEKARQLRIQIQNEALAGLRVIRQNIKQCIVNGGPNSTLQALVPQQPSFQQEVSLP